MYIFSLLFGYYRIRISGSNRFNENYHNMSKALVFRQWKLASPPCASSV